MLWLLIRLDAHLPQQDFGLQIEKTMQAVIAVANKLLE